MRSYVVVVSLVLISSCGGGDGGGLTQPSVGAIEVRTTTSGESPPDGYTVSLDGGPDSPIGPAATVSLSGLEPGSHIVRLAGLPDVCTVAGENPKTVSVTAGATTIVSFEISCVPPVGTIHVATTTTGPAPATYTLLLDGASQGPVGATTTRALESIPVGGHSVGLSDLPANCTLAGDNPRPVTVPGGGSVTVSFSITCTPPPAQTGSLRITVATTGSSLDPDGYLVLVNGNPPQPISTSGALTVTGLAVQVHTVQLSGLAANCSVAGTNPRSVTVTAGSTAEVTFAVVCTAPQPTTGSLRVITATTGPDADADGYAFAVDGQAPQAIAASGTVTVENLGAGSHMVAISGVAANCTVDGGNTRTVTVTPGGTVEVSFAVTCTALTVGRWTPMASGTDIALLSVWGSSGTDVFTLGEERTGSSIFHYDGQGWSTHLLMQDVALRALWGSRVNDVFAVGFSSSFTAHEYDGIILHYDGTNWSRMQGPGVGQVDPEIDVDFHGIWGTSGTDVFAVGFKYSNDYYGLIAHYDGSIWSAMTIPFEQRRIFEDVFGTSSRDVYAVGWTYAREEEGLGGSVIVHYDGSQWTEQPIGVEGLSFSGVWASSPNDVFAVGSLDDGNTSAGVIYHSDGAQWSAMNVPATAGLADVWGTSGSDVYAVGDGAILHYDGQSWSKVLDQGGFSVWGSSSSDVFVVGANGRILHGTP